MGSDKAGRLARTLPPAVLLFALYWVIFGFSAQDGEASGSLSLRISQGCVAILNSLTGGGFSEQMKTELALYFEHPVRKAAHFCEYAVMGGLIFGVLSPWRKPESARNGRFVLFVVLWVFVSGALDEFHQLFVPGRYGSFADVLLDTCGGAFGLWLCLWASRRKRRRLSGAVDAVSRPE